MNGDSQCSFTWGGKAGLSYEIDKNWDLTFDVMWVSQTGGSTTSGSKKKQVSYSITEPGSEVFNSSTIDTTPGQSPNVTCGSAYPGGNNAPSLCFDKTNPSTTHYIQDVRVDSLRYTPAGGLKPDAWPPLHLWSP